jgi:hypothetical protein
MMDGQILATLYELQYLVFAAAPGKFGIDVKDINRHSFSALLLQNLLGHYRT